MPPTRTFPPAKAVKTERTHEENQERAYVAASRRSDRSLEARVESARRASEIHKRRTGRALKITVDDVANEEMYEEEDDNIPFQYRRLATHLQTGSQDFHDRLTAYLSTNVAMRTAVAEAVGRSYAQNSYPNVPQFSNHFPSPMLPHQTQHNQPLQSAPSPAMYRHAPYPMPRPPPQQGFQPTPHRSASFASLPIPESTGPQHSPVVQPTDNRRMSVPVLPADGSPMQMHTPTSAHSVHSTPPQRPSFPSGSFSRHSYKPQQPVSQPQQSPYPAYDMSSFQYNLSPLTTQLPPEAQGLLGSTLDYSDPLSSMLMAGSGNLPTTYYDFGPQPTQPPPATSNIGRQQTHPTLDGLGSTLAPAAMDNQFEVDLNQIPNFFNDAYASHSKGVTPSGTPGVDEAGWTDFIHDQWADMPPSSQNSQ